MSCSKTGPGLYLKVEPQGGGYDEYLNSYTRLGDIHVVGASSAWRIEGEGDDYVLASGFTSQGQAQAAAEVLFAELRGRGVPSSPYVTDAGAVDTLARVGRFFISGTPPNLSLRADASTVSTGHANQAAAEAALLALVEPFGVLDVQDFLS